MQKMSIDIDGGCLSTLCVGIDTNGSCIVKFLHSFQKGVDQNQVVSINTLLKCRPFSVDKDYAVNLSLIKLKKS